MTRMIISAALGSLTTLVVGIVSVSSIYGEFKTRMDLVEQTVASTDDRREITENRLTTIENETRGIVSEARSTVEDYIDSVPRIHFADTDLHVEPKEWVLRRRGNQVPTRLIRASEGICFLSRIAGKFEDTDESIHLEIRDGYWELGGSTSEEEIVASARCWRFPQAGIAGSP